MMLEHLIKKEWGPTERKALWEDILRNNMINVLYEGVSTFQPLLFDQWTKYTQHNEPHNAADGSVVVQPMIQINLSDISSVTLEYIEMKLLRLKQSKLLSSPAKIELPSLIASQPPQSQPSTTSSSLSSLVSATPTSIQKQPTASSLLPSLASAVGFSKPMTINATPTLEGTCLPLITITGVDSTKKLERENSFTLSNTFQIANRATNTAKKTYSYNSTNAFDNSLLNPFWLATNNSAAAATPTTTTTTTTSNLSGCCSDDHSPRTPQSPLSPSSWNPSGVSSPLNQSSSASRSSSVSPMPERSKTAFYPAGTTAVSAAASVMMPGSTRMNDTEYISQAFDKRRISFPNTMSTLMAGSIENTAAAATADAATASAASSSGMDEEFQITLVIYDSRKRDDSIKPFECSFPGCGKRFSDRSNLMTHIRKHTQEKPFMCRVCGRGFSHKSTLRDHEHAHTGEQPYRCEKCGKCFSQKSNLQRHTKIHTGKMPYKCPLCSKTFNQSSNLKTHINAKHHNGNNVTATAVVAGNGIGINGIHNISSLGMDNNSLNSLSSSSSFTSSASSPSSPFPISQQQQQQQNSSSSSSSSLRSNFGMNNNGVVMNSSASSFLTTALSTPQKGNNNEFLQTFGFHKGTPVKNEDGFLPPITSVSSISPIPAVPQPHLPSTSSSSSSLSSSLSSNLTSSSMIPSSSVNSPRSQSPPLNKSAFTSISFLP